MNLEKIQNKYATENELFTKNKEKVSDEQINDKIENVLNTFKTASDLLLRNRNIKLNTNCEEKTKLIY